MGTTIEWTNVTWNPVTGCEQISPGCARCYAKEQWDRRHKARLAGKAMPTQYAEPFEVVRCRPERLDAPLHWRAPRMVFVNSVSDLFHEAVPDEFIDRVFAVMALCPQHTFQILTKRAERMRDYMVALDRAIRIPTEPFPRWRSEAEAILDARKDWKTSATSEWPLPNVWIGVSCENQPFADERITLLLETPAAIRFVSYEPALGPVDFRPWLALWRCDCGWWDQDGDGPAFTMSADVTPYCPRCGMDISGVGRLDWVIAGGESGPKARPCQVDWIRSVVQQCRAAGVPTFVKQLGAHVIDRNDAGFEGDPGDSWTPETKFDDLTAQGWQGDPVRIRLRVRKGGDPAEWPADLRVREYPATQRG